VRLSNFLRYLRQNVSFRALPRKKNLRGF